MLPKSESLMLYGAGPQGEAGKMLILVTLNMRAFGLLLGTTALAFSQCSVLWCVTGPWLSQMRITFLQVLTKCDFFFFFNFYRVTRPWC